MSGKKRQKSNIRRCLTSFIQNEQGATAIEYALIAGGLSIVIAGAAYTLGDSLIEFFYQPVQDALEE